MCAGAIVNARVPRLVYGCPDPKAGAVHTLYQICQDPRLNHRVDACAAACWRSECAEVLRAFFRRAAGAGEEIAGAVFGVRRFGRPRRLTIR